MTERILDGILVKTKMLTAVLGHGLTVAADRVYLVTGAVAHGGTSFAKLYTICI